MRKIILSRKGFDSGSGGYPSPILPDGTMISLPIPEESSICYSDLKYKGLSYLDLMKQLGIKDYDENSKAHLDPDINCSVMHRDSQNWEAVFGQCGSSASHLDNHNVVEGDIFLFFGWFRKTIETDAGYKYDPSDKEGRHIIWGYMEVGQKIKIVGDKKYPEHYLRHPHFEDKNKPNNTAYIASNRLCFDSSLSGAGVFKYDERLVLSCEGDLKSVWKLPKYFHPDYNTKISYHTDSARWVKKEDCCLLKSVGRGQEFVIYNNSEIKKWAEELILKNA